MYGLSAYFFVMRSVCASLRKTVHQLGDVTSLGCAGLANIADIQDSDKGGAFVGSD